MADLIFRIIIAVIITEGVVEIFQSKLFDFLRERTDPYGYLGTFLYCGFCQSVWIGIITSFAFNLNVGFIDDCFFEPFFLSPIVFRLSNIWHSFIGLFYGLSRVLIDQVFALILEKGEK